jgi:hypothetical protein
MTLALEISFSLVFPNIRKHKKNILLIILVNILTNPIVVLTYFLTQLYTGWNVVYVLIIMESAAVITEWFFYKTRGMGFRKPFLFSIAANGFSYGVGFLIQII